MVGGYNGAHFSATNARHALGEKKTRVHPPLPLYPCPTLGFPYMAPAVPGHGQCRHSCARVPLDAENKSGHTFVPLTLTVAFTPAPPRNKICLKWKMKKRLGLVCVRTYTYVVTETEAACARSRMYFDL